MRYNAPEYRLIRIVVAELYRFNDGNRSFGDYDFRKRVALRRYCLLLPGANSLIGCRRNWFWFWLHE